MNAARSRTVAAPQPLPANLVDVVCERLADDKRVRRTLPGKGRLHVDRQLPFLCVYRQPAGHDDVGTGELIQGEASYLVVPSGAIRREDVAELVERVVATLTAQFGAFLVVEVWAGPDGGKANNPAIPSVSPRFTLHADEDPDMTRIVETLQSRLSKVKVLKQRVEVVTAWGSLPYPASMEALLTPLRARELGCRLVGVEVPPVYRKPKSEAEFPLLQRALRHGLSLALRHTYFEFTRALTTHRPRHYHALGRRAMVKAVWEVDRQLAAVSNQFDYLLQLTPVNTRGARRQFESQKFERAPEFHYRPLPVDPAELKRELYKIPVSRVEDPTLQRLFEDKQEELELKITMLRDRDTPRFLYESLQLFGGVGDALLQVAERTLREIEPRAKAKGRSLSAEAFCQRAQSEIDRYRESSGTFKAAVQVNDETTGLFVSRGKLWVGPDVSIPEGRVQALLAHEVGTHLLAYYNGRSQPFRQLYAGLPGYEELQEGLAVLAEHLVGGLNRARLRLLAGRVVAVRHLTDGASFVDTFRSLTKTYGFGTRAAFTIAMRIYRGGGLTKDAVYLRGLQSVVEYVRKGGDLRPLLVGKIAIEHIAMVKELQYRDVLTQPASVPRYLTDPRCRKRLDQLREGGGTVLDLVRGAGGSAVELE